jgi:hypothetical protein
VRAGHAEVNVVGDEEGARCGVVELPAIVTLNNFYRDSELRTNIGKKMSHRRKRVRFETKGKCPNIMRKII